MTAHKDGNITQNRDNGRHSTLIGDKPSMHGPWKKEHMSLTPDAGK